MVLAPMLEVQITRAPMMKIWRCFDFTAAAATARLAASVRSSVFRARQRDEEWASETQKRSRRPHRTRRRTEEH